MNKNKTSDLVISLKRDLLATVKRYKKNQQEQLSIASDEDEVKEMMRNIRLINELISQIERLFLYFHNQLTKGML